MGDCKGDWVMPVVSISIFFFFFFFLKALYFDKGLCRMHSIDVVKVGLMWVHPMSCDKSDKKHDKHVNFELLYNDNIY